MTPGARVAAAIQILDRILAGEQAEPALIAWARTSRFAGSGDRAAVRDLVFQALRRRDSLAALGGALSGRGLMLGLLRAEGADPDTIFSGTGHAPPPLTEAERSAGAPIAQAEALPDLPDWLWPLWQASLGARALPLAHTMRNRAPLWLRVNPRRATLEQAIAALTDAGIEAIPDPHLPIALRVTSGERRVHGSEPYRAGWIELQDLSPQIACSMLAPPPGQQVLDYCAGGGGKSLALLAATDLSVTAHDAAPSRMSDLPERAARAGVSVTLSPPAPLGRNYDLVIGDVPCSGSGTWRRTPDAKWRLTPERLVELCALQAEILDDCANLVRPGGRIAYMTCSLLDAENGDQIDRFVAGNQRFTETERRLLTPEDASDGFFVSILTHSAGAA